MAFLDADDFFAKDRFKASKRILSTDDSVDGVYEATGSYNEVSGEFIPQLTTLSEIITPEDLFYKMGPIGGKGVFNTNSVVVRKEIFDKVGLFDENLLLSQDTHMWLKMAMKCRLMPGSIDSPVCYRRIHPHNRSRNLSKILDTRPYLFKSLVNWAKDNAVNRKKISVLLVNYFWSAHYTSIRRERKKKLWKGLKIYGGMYRDFPVIRNLPLAFSFNIGLLSSSMERLKKKL